MEELQQRLANPQLPEEEREGLQRLLALDPFVGARRQNDLLFGLREPRFTYVKTVVGGQTASSGEVFDVTYKEISRNLSARTRYTTHIKDANWGWLSQLILDVGPNDKQTATVTSSSVREQLTSDEVVSQLRIFRQEGESSSIEIYFDNVFGTLVYNATPPYSLTDLLSGLVQNESGQPLPNALVTLAQGKRKIQTHADADGRYAIRGAALAAGPATVLVGRTPLKTLTVGRGPLSNVNLGVAGGAPSPSAAAPERPVPSPRAPAARLPTTTQPLPGPTREAPRKGGPTTAHGGAPAAAPPTTAPSRVPVRAGRDQTERDPAALQRPDVGIGPNDIARCRPNDEAAAGFPLCVMVHNFGNVRTGQVTVRCRLNGAPPVSTIIPRALEPGEGIAVACRIQMPPGTRGSLDVAVEAPGDANPANNQVRVSLPISGAPRSPSGREY